MLSTSQFAVLGPCTDLVPFLRLGAARVQVHGCHCNACIPLKGLGFARAVRRCLNGSKVGRQLERTFRWGSSPFYVANGSDASGGVDLVRSETRIPAPAIGRAPPILCPHP